MTSKNISFARVENGDDGLEVSKEILKDNTSVDEMNFKNTYRGQGKVRIDGKKVLLDQGVSSIKRWRI